MLVLHCCAGAVPFVEFRTSLETDTHTYVNAAGVGLVVGVSLKRRSRPQLVLPTSVAVRIRHSAYCARRREKCALVIDFRRCAAFFFPGGVSSKLLAAKI